MVPVYDGTALPLDLYIMIILAMHKLLLIGCEKFKVITIMSTGWNTGLLRVDLKIYSGSMLCLKKHVICIKQVS